MNARVSALPADTKSNSKFGIPADFEKLRQQYHSQGQLYEDPDFPAVDSSVFTKHRPPSYPFKWLRPHDIVTSNPYLFVHSTSRFDLKQGMLGDCWVVASLAAISEYEEMVKRIVPDGQSFHPDWYAGMFVFRFWHFGKWKEVIVDDRLPTYNGQLIFIHSEQRNEFWGALVEKAYAKLIGSYEALKAGLIGDALDDFTSGLTESFKLKQNDNLPKNLESILLRSFERKSLVGAGIAMVEGGQKVLTGNILDNGLVAGHAYTVTDIRKFKIADSRGAKVITLIRIRNPWGTSIEWKGAWCDSSPLWNNISLQDRQAVGLVKADDGEFWMDWSDFMANFDNLDVCHLPPTLSVLSAKRWQSVSHHDAWVANKTAGGRPFCRETHWRNPQFKVHLKDSEHDDNDTCTILVSVMQEDKRRNQDHNAIGFAIYPASPKYKLPYPKEYFLYNRYVATAPYFVNARENVGRFELNEGSYIIVPCTYDANVESRFLLRVFFENPGSDVKHGKSAAGAMANQQNGSNSSRMSSSSYGGSTVDGPASPSSISTSASNQFNGPSIQTSNDQLKALFTSIAGPKGIIDAYQLIRIINNTEPIFQRFPLKDEVGKSLVALADRDDSFRLDYNEMEFLIHYLRAWVRTFNQLDTSSSGSIPSHNLRDVISGMGFRLPNTLVRRFIHRFSDANNRISISGFICCLAFVVKMMNIFNECSDGKKKAYLTLDDFFKAGLVI